MAPNYRIERYLMCVAVSAALLGCATESLGTVTAGVAGGAATISASSRIWRKIPDAMSPVVSIDSVDGQSTKASTSKVLVAPGHHTLSVTCRYGFLNNTRKLELDAKAGGYYEVEVMFGGGTGSCEAAIQELK